MNIFGILASPDDVHRKVVGTFFLYEGRVVYCGSSRGFVVNCAFVEERDTFLNGAEYFLISLDKDLDKVEFGILEPMDFNDDDHVVFTQRKISKTMSINTNKERILFSLKANGDNRIGAALGYYHKAFVNPCYRDWQTVLEPIRKKEVKSALIAPNVIMSATRIGVVTLSNREGMDFMWIHKDKAHIVDNEFVHEYLGSENLASVRVLREIQNAL